MALGIIQNNQNGSPLYTSSNQFDGINPGISDILVRYTYYGDANLDGVVDGQDYARIDAGYDQHLTGWYNGDFNYDGVIDGSDYTLIDNSFNNQISYFTLFSSGKSVPEPLIIGFILLAILYTVAKRHRHNY